MCRVLVVEDRQSELDLMQLLVEHLGCEFHGQLDGTEFLDVVRKVKPNLIVLDLRLPGGITGIDLAQMLREDPELRTIPILAMTAAPETYPEPVALAAGCDCYLRKPFNVQAWESVVRCLMYRSSS